MPTVPTAGDLPAVQSQRPDFIPQRGADSSAPFGGQVGAAGQALGKSLEDTGMIAGQIGADFAIQEALRASKQADADSMSYASNLGYKSLDGNGGPGFYAMKGQTAVDNQKAYVDALKAQAQQTAANMDDRTKQMYLNQFQIRLENETNTANRFVMQQQGVAAHDTSVARIGAATDAAVNTYNDPVAIEHNAQIIRGEMADQGRRNGWSPEVLAEQTKLAVSKTYSDVIKTALARNDVPAAAAAYNLYGPQMDAASSVSIQEHLREPLLRNNAIVGVNKILGENTTIGPGANPGGGLHNTYTPGSGYYDLVHPGEGNGTNPITGAAGPVQVIPGTQREFAASPMGAGVDIHTEAGARQFTKWYGDQNAQKIQAVTGQPATNAQVVAAHLLGPGGVTSILSRPDEPISKTLGEAAVRNNPGPLPHGDLTGREAMETISRYYGRAAGQFAGPGAPTTAEPIPAGLPTAASVAAATRVHPDFAGALEQVLAQTAGQPELQRAMVSELRSRESIYNMSVRTQQKTLGDGMKDTMAALESGRTDVVIPELAIRHAFDPEKADEIMGRLNEAKENGRVFSSLKFMAPADFATRRQELVDSLGSAASVPKKGTVATDGAQSEDPNAGIKGFAQRQKELATIDRLWAQRQAAFKADPAAYVRNEPSVAAAYATDLKDPANLAKAVQQSMAVQQQMNPNEDPRALSTTATDQVVKRLHTVDPETGDMGAELDGMAKQYGTAWPSVMHDLVVHGHLAPSYQVLAAMTEPGQAGPRANLQRALQQQATKGDKFGSSVPEVDKKVLPQSIETALQPFKATTTVGGGEMFDSVVMPAVKTLATFYAEQGQGADASAQRAVKEIISTKYEMSGMTRAPKTFEGKPLGVDAVLAAGAGVQRALKPEDLAPTSATVRQAQRGSWVANPDGAGVTLVAPAAQGGYLPVRRKDGSYVSLSFANMPHVDPAPMTGVAMVPN